MEEPQESTLSESDDLTAAQLEKLRLEIADLKNRNKWDQRISHYVPLISVLVTVAGFTFGVYQFRVQYQANLDTQKEAARFNDERSKRDDKNSEREFAKPLFEKQIALYFAATETLATIAATNNQAERKDAEKKFWQLYYGPLAVVENKDVSGVMVEFGDCLAGTQICDNSRLRELSLVLTSKVQKSITHDWGSTLFDFSKDRFDYDEPKKP